ncbi:MAG TPA: lipid-A-disaccharide synthase [Caulobacterales bacterium]|nr:lipid-A-disaccharide synthase [Caulobacterales bacterium]
MSRIFLVAAESSGDALGADLVRALRARDPKLEIAGVGGTMMAEQGVKSAVDISGLAVLGFVEGLKAYGRVKQAVKEAVAAILAAQPNVVVLIDSWGFTLRVAQGVRAAAPQIKLVKYIGPQVWATRPGRAETLAKSVDHLIAIHDFEAPYYMPFGLPVTVCGHPAFGRYKAGDAAAFRARHALGADEKMVLVLPGSRATEVRRVGPVLWEAARLLQAQRPELRLAVVAAGAVADAVKQQAPQAALIVDEPEKEDAFAAATIALAASGTVTTEVALQGAPVIVGYKVGAITGALMKRVIRTPYVTLMNVAAKREIVPEFLQERLTAENLAAAAAPLLDDASARAERVRLQNEALDSMGRGARPAAEIAADAVLDVLER